MEMCWENDEIYIFLSSSVIQKIHSRWCHERYYNFTHHHHHQQRPWRWWFQYWFGPESAICDEHFALTHSLSLSAFYMLSCSELYLFFFCLIRESIASQHRNAYCGWEVAAAYALFKHEHKNGAFYENERERAIATHLSNDTKKEEEICLISLHFFPSRCGFSSIRFDNLQSMSFSVNNNRLKCISVAQCRMSIVSNLNRSARTRKHSTLSEVYNCSHIQYRGSFFIRAYISL